MKNYRAQPTNRSRRDFLKSSAAVSAFTFLPSYLVLGKDSSDPRLPPSERLNLAVIGIGNQGNGNRTAMLASGLCDVVALCDVDLQGNHTQASIKAHPNVPRFTDFRKMFDKMGNPRLAARFVGRTDRIPNGGCDNGDMMSFQNKYAQSIIARC